MKRVIVAFFLIVVSMSCLFADDRIDRTLSDIAKFMETNNESIASISHGITSNAIYNYVDGIIVKVISKKDFNGLFNEGLVIKCTPYYYYHNKRYKNEYFIFISNIIVNKELKEGSTIEKFKTILGKSSMEPVPYDGGNDTKYVVFTFESNNKHLIALSDGHPGVALPNIDDVFIFPGIWLRGDVSIDYLTFEAIRNNKDILILVGELENNSSMYTLDVVHTICLRLDGVDEIEDISENCHLSQAILNFSKMFHGLPFSSMTKYIDYNIDGHSFYIVATDEMINYYKQEVNANPPVLYLRSIGSYEYNNTIKVVFYLVDYQRFFYEDKVDSVIKANRKK
jgi:hypothetical protein